MKSLLFFAACLYLFVVISDANESTQQERRFLKSTRRSKKSGIKSTGIRSGGNSSMKRDQRKSKASKNQEKSSSRSNRSKTSNTVSDTVLTSIPLERFSMDLTASDLNTAELTRTMEDYLLEAFADQYEAVSSVYLVAELIAHSRRLQKTTNADFFGRADFAGQKPNRSSLIRSQKSVLDRAELIQKAIDKNPKIGDKVILNSVTTNVPSDRSPTATPSLKPPTSQPNSLPSSIPLSDGLPIPSSSPSSVETSSSPTATPSLKPPTAQPNSLPSSIPLSDGLPIPSSSPSSVEPSSTPWEIPVPAQSNMPQSDIPSDVPSKVPSTVPNLVPSTILPSSVPANLVVPTSAPMSVQPSPLMKQSNVPQFVPSGAPDFETPTIGPSDLPSSVPVNLVVPTSAPMSVQPSSIPPSGNPSMKQSNVPQFVPSGAPGFETPTIGPSTVPVSIVPSSITSDGPVFVPSLITDPSSAPSSVQPSSIPSSANPTLFQSDSPQSFPSDVPDSLEPSSILPSTVPVSEVPSNSQISEFPVFVPSLFPDPTSAPEFVPSFVPHTTSMPIALDAYKLRFQIDFFRLPLSSEFDAIETLTANYVSDYLQNKLSTNAAVLLLIRTVKTGEVVTLNQPVEISFVTEVTFSNMEESDIGQVQAELANAFGVDIVSYEALLATLPSSNIFSTTTSVQFEVGSPNIVPSKSPTPSSMSPMSFGDKGITASPLSLSFTVDTVRVADDSEIESVGGITQSYIDSTLQSAFGASYSGFSDVAKTGQSTPVGQPAEITFEVIGFFSMTMTMPTVDQVDAALESGFSSPQVENFLAMLRTNLSPENLFSTTTAVEISPV